MVSVKLQIMFLKFCFILFDGGRVMKSTVCLFFLFHPCTFKKLPDEPDLQEKGVCFFKKIIFHFFLKHLML